MLAHIGNKTLKEKLTKFRRILYSFSINLLAELSKDEVFLYLVHHFLDRFKGPHDSTMKVIVKGNSAKLELGLSYLSFFS